VAHSIDVYSIRGFLRAGLELGKTTAGIQEPRLSRRRRRGARMCDRCVPSSLAEGLGHNHSSDNFLIAHFGTFCDVMILYSKAGG